MLHRHHPIMSILRFAFYVVQIIIGSDSIQALSCHSNLFTCRLFQERFIASIVTFQILSKFEIFCEKEFTTKKDLKMDEIVCMQPILCLQKHLKSEQINNEDMFLRFYACISLLFVFAPCLKFQPLISLYIISNSKIL